MSDVDYEIANERVSRGIEWLDANLPDWREKVDLHRLDLGSSRDCILGQYFADAAARQGGLHSNGFCVAMNMYSDTHFDELGLDSDGEFPFSVLTEVWKDRLTSAVV